MTDSQDTTPESPQGVDRKAEGGCPVMHGSVTAQGSESENPAIDAPHPKDRPPAHQPGLVAQPARPVGAARALARKGNPLGADFDYAEEFEKLDVAALKPRHRRGARRPRRTGGPPTSATTAACSSG